MSHILTTENEIVSFSEFLLSESIKPKSIEYGSNPSMDDGSFSHYYPSHISTFFKTTSGYFCVFLSKKDSVVGFGYSEKPSTDMLDYNFIEQSRISTSGALSVFSYVVFIILEMVSKFKLSEFRFEGANKKLDKVYDRLPNNKYFMKAINDSGFSYSGLSSGFHVYSRAPV